jgi:hypothetical protein
MPYTLEWLEKPHILYLRITGEHTEAEFSAWVDEAIVMANAVPDALVHTLIDLEGLKKFPSLTYLGREIKRLMTESPNRDMSAAYGVSRLTRYTLELILRVAPVRIKVFSERKEALDFLLAMIRHEMVPPGAVAVDAAEDVAAETPAD